jgi:hypothetical protein
MAIDLVRALDQRIRELERQLAAVRAARKALSGEKGPAGGGDLLTRRGRKRRKLTAAQRADISRRMKAAWARRKKAQKA